MRKRLFVLAAVVVLGVGVWRFGEIRDWLILQNYQPPAAIVSLADTTTMTPLARRDFYISRPEIDPKPEFSSNCPVTEKALVLGCYTRGRIFLLEVERTELAKVEDVTAAHEMLHAAYNKLSGKERSKVNQSLNEYFTATRDQKLLDLVAEYDKSEPGQRLNELHSILGTQVAVLTPQLEQYYSRYFTNRQSIVASYMAYESVFESIQNQQSTLKQQIDNLRTQLDSLQARLDREQTELQSVNAQLDSYLAGGNTEAYNGLVPSQNSLVRQYNNDVTRYKSMVEVHNQKVEQFNALSLKQSELIDSLDSSKYNSR